MLHITQRRIDSSNKDDMPGMCLAVVAVVVMLVVGRGSATAAVEKAVTAAAEEVGDGWCGQGPPGFRISVQTATT